MFSDQAIMMLDTGSVAVFDVGVEYQEVVEESRHEELDLHASDHQEDAALLELQVGESRGSKHLDAASFKVVQVLSVVNAALAIDLVVLDPNFDFMFGFHGVDRGSLFRCRRLARTDVDLPTSVLILPPEASTMDLVGTDDCNKRRRLES
jgi:hypothetical protein